MTLKELLKKLKAFDCEALRDKDVVHYFASSNAYSYLERVKDVYFDAEKGRFVIVCEDPVQAQWGNKANITVNKDKK